MAAFSKYTAIGNDFIIIDNRDGKSGLTAAEKKRMCCRRLGVGADGLIELKTHQECDFEFLYYNSDGEVGSLCGNGARCVLAFAKSVGMVTGPHVKFCSCDGILNGGFADSGRTPYVMFNHVKDTVKHDENNFYVFTGSPHHIRFVSDIEEIDVVSEGRAIAHGPHYGSPGANVNFVEVTSDTSMCIRTYERGVEDETLACGSGVVAAAVASWAKNNDLTSESVNTFILKYQFGNLEVSFLVNEGVFIDIKLKGPVKHVFDGTYSLDNYLAVSN